MTRPALLLVALGYAANTSAPGLHWQLECPRWEAPPCAWRECREAYKVCTAYVWRTSEGASTDFMED